MKDKKKSNLNSAKVIGLTMLLITGISIEFLKGLSSTMSTFLLGVGCLLVTGNLVSKFIWSNGNGK